MSEQLTGLLYQVYCRYLISDNIWVDSIHRGSGAIRRLHYLQSLGDKDVEWRIAVLPVRDSGWAQGDWVDINEDQLAAIRPCEETQEKKEAKQ